MNWISFRRRSKRPKANNEELKATGIYELPRECTENGNMDQHTQTEEIMQSHLLTNLFIQIRLIIHFAIW